MTILQKCDHTIHIYNPRHHCKLKGSLDSFEKQRRSNARILQHCRSLPKWTNAGPVLPWACWGQKGFFVRALPEESPPCTDGPLADVVLVTSTLGPIAIQGGLGAGISQREMYGWCPWGVLEVPSGIAGTIHT